MTGRKCQAFFYNSYIFGMKYKHKVTFSLILFIVHKSGEKALVCLPPDFH